MEDGRRLTKEEYDALAYHELQRLDGECKRMLHNREASKKQETANLANQCNVIKALESEKAGLQRLVDIRTVYSFKEITKIKEIKRLVSKYENYIAKNSEKQTEIENVKYKIKEMNNHIALYQRNHPVRAKKLDLEEKQRKEIEQLENLCAVEARSFSQIMAQNKNLQEEVNHLLIDKLKHNQMYENLLQALGKGKRELFNLLEQTAQANEENQKISFKCETLGTEADKDFKVHVNEFRDQNIALECDEDLRDFLFIKSKNRSNNADDGSQDNAQEKKGNILYEKLEFYKGLLDGITVGLGKENVDQLLNSYLKIEEDNFNIYSFLNEENLRINQTSYEVEVLEKEINDHNAMNERKKLDMFEKVRMVTEHYEELLSQLEERRSTLAKFEFDFSTILEGVGHLFEFALCDWTPILRILGTKDQVTQFNLHLFVGAIENRIRLLTSPTRYRARVRATLIMNTNHRDSELMKTSCDRVSMATPCPYCAEVLDSSDTTLMVRPLECDEVKASVLSDIKRGRWRPLMHNLPECPMPIACRQRVTPT